MNEGGFKSVVVKSRRPKLALRARQTYAHVRWLLLGNLFKRTPRRNDEMHPLTIRQI